MFKDEYHPKIKKDLKLIDKSVINEIKKEHIDKIFIAPYKCNELKGELSGIRAYHFKKNKTEYRICFFINEEINTLYFLMIGKRENFYELLKQRLNK